MPSVFQKLKNLKGKSRYEAAENYSMLGVVGGALLFGLGVAMSAFNPAGISAITCMAGAIVAFASAALLVFAWLARDIFGK